MSDFTQVEDQLYSRIVFVETAKEFFVTEEKTILKANIKVPPSFASHVKSIIPATAKTGCIEKAFDALMTKIFIRGLEHSIIEWQVERAEDYVEEISKRNPEIALIMINQIAETAQRIIDEKGV